MASKWVQLSAKIASLIERQITKCLNFKHSVSDGRKQKGREWKEREGKASFIFILPVKLQV